MLPRATHGRQERESRRGQLGGRTQEISRLIGRALRAAVDLKALGPRTVILDCDVLQADGGTRSAAITGAFAALALALEGLRRQGLLTDLPLKEQVAAVSVGAWRDQLWLDLDYEQDSQAAVDANFVGTGHGQLIEVQLTGEAGPFPAALLPAMLALAQEGLQELFKIQDEALRPWLPLSW
jgi:ribonuclease PH